MKKISTPAFKLLDKIKTPVVGLVAQRGRKEVKKMEYGITATFTEEEIVTILFALTKRAEYAKKMAEEEDEEGSIRYWLKEYDSATHVYYKIRDSQEEMPW